MRMETGRPSMRYGLLYFVLLVVLALAAAQAGVYVASAQSGTKAMQPVDVYVIEIRGEIDSGMASFVGRSLDDARKRRAEMVVIDIETFGGRLDSAIEIRDLILYCEIPTMAFVKNRAHSAGALITLSAQYVAISPAGTVGSAEPRIQGITQIVMPDAKSISAVRAEFVATARARGRDEKLAAAMVDQNVEIPGLVDVGDLLNIGGEKAVQYGLADVVASTWEDALVQLGYSPIATTVSRISLAERVAGFLTSSPYLSVLLLVIGFIGLVVEVLTPGFGLPGTVGVLAFVLFFGGRWIAGLAGMESVVLTGVGFLLLLIEAFALPGFGIAGISGIILMLLGVGSTFTSWTEAAMVLLLSMVVSGVILALLGRYLSRSPVWGRFILKTRAETKEGYVSGPVRDDLLGAIVETVTPLRPAGMALFGEERIDVVSEGEFIDKGVLVKVTSVSGNRVVVRPHREVDRR